MKYTLLFILLFAPCLVSAQPTIQWQKCYGGSGNDEPGGLIETLDGGYIMAGQTHSIDGDVTFNHGNYDLWIVKFKADGSIQWQKTYGGSQDDGGGGILPTFDGGYIIAATTNSIDGDLKGLRTDITQGDIWVFKIDSLGVIQWQKTFGGSKEETAISIIPGGEGNYVVLGITGSHDGDVKGYHGGSGFDSWVFLVLILISSYPIFLPTSRPLYNEDSSLHLLLVSCLIQRPGGLQIG